MSWEDRRLLERIADALEKAVEILAKLERPPLMIVDGSAIGPAIANAKPGEIVERSVPLGPAPAPRCEHGTRLTLRCPQCDPRT